MEGERGSEGQRVRQRERGEPFSCGAAVNLTNLIQLARAGDGVIKSTQVTNGGESNYFTKKWSDGGGRRDTLLFLPSLFHHLPLRPHQARRQTHSLCSTASPFSFPFFFFLFLFFPPFYIAVNDGWPSLK